MIFAATSVNGALVRLTEQAWRHISERHPEVVDQQEILRTIQSPEFVQEGDFGAFLAVRQRSDGYHVVVVYREVTNQYGFVITAYVTERLGRRRSIWTR